MTARNYLFAANQDDVALTRLISAAARVTGFLSGAPGGPLPGWYGWEKDNSAFIADLNARLLANYPKARRPFHATRIWTNLVWQPVYLAAIAVHVHGAVPRLSGMSQSRQNLDISGYRLPPGPQFTGSIEDMIAQAGGDVRRMADVSLAELVGVAPLKRLPALRLLADRLLTVMAALPRYRVDITAEDQHRFCALWLDAMGLAGLGALETLDLPGGHRAVVINRQGCCLDYLALPGTYCTTCPRQDDDLRRRRQYETAVAEMDDAAP